MPPAKPRAPVRSRRPFRDNPPLILAGIVILLAGLGGMVWLADRTSTLSPDFLTEVVLYALYATNITMLVALGFVLARNVSKSVFDGRSGLPLGRFRANLVWRWCRCTGSTACPGNRSRSSHWLMSRRRRCRRAGPAAQPSA